MQLDKKNDELTFHYNGLYDSKVKELENKYIQDIEKLKKEYDGKVATSVKNQTDWIISKEKDRLREEYEIIKEQLEDEYQEKRNNTGVGTFFRRIIYSQKKN